MAWLSMATSLFCFFVGRAVGRSEGWHKGCNDTTAYIARPRPNE